MPLLMNQYFLTLDNVMLHYFTKSWPSLLNDRYYVFTNIISIENIYPHANYKYEYLADDSLLPEIKIVLNPNALG